MDLNNCLIFLNKYFCCDSCGQGACVYGGGDCEGSDAERYW